MAKVVMDGAVKQTVNAANSAATTFDLSGAAVSGFIKVESAVDPLTGVAIATNDAMFYAVSAGALREMGWGVVDKTAHTITRNVISTVNAGTRGTTKLDFSGGAAPTLIGDFSSFVAVSTLNHNRSGNPGVRLTLVQGDPVPSTDQTAKTNIYAEPMRGCGIPLYLDAAGLIPFTPELPPSTVSKALGTLASATIPIDVYLDFGVTSAGVFSLTFVPWTNTTTQATAVVDVKGYDYKTGDYRFLHVGCFAPTSTTTTADAVRQRLLWNTYNQVSRLVKVSYATSHNYSSATVRQMNTVTTNQIEYMLGKPQDAAINISAALGGTVDGAYQTVYAGLDSTTATTIACALEKPGVFSNFAGAGSAQLAKGSHFWSMNQKADAVGTSTFCPFSVPCSINTMLMI